jgi:hypothetical protein
MFRLKFTRAAEALRPAYIREQELRTIPDFGHLCQVCGQDVCMEDRCRPKSGVKCRYPICYSKLHVIAKCDILGSRCSTCNYRGHPAFLCPTRTAQEWFDLFETYRSEGYWTSKANSYIGHGFFMIHESIRDDYRLPKYDQLCQENDKNVGKINAALSALYNNVQREREQASRRGYQDRPRWS